VGAHPGGEARVDRSHQIQDVLVGVRQSAPLLGSGDRDAARDGLVMGDSIAQRLHTLRERMLGTAFP
jgi:hypothetical protein